MELQNALIFRILVRCLMDCVIVRDAKYVAQVRLCNTAHSDLSEMGCLNVIVMRRYLALQVPCGTSLSAVIVAYITCSEAVLYAFGAWVFQMSGLGRYMSSEIMMAWRKWRRYWREIICVWAGGVSDVQCHEKDSGCSMEGVVRGMDAQEILIRHVKEKILRRLISLRGVPP